jgi:two-component system nitrate/nitrite sensor histidine kinase NarX
MENMRLLALEKEAAVSQERGFIARELHDSIAQSLAFLKIQVQLMQDSPGRQQPGRRRRACCSRSTPACASVMPMCASCWCTSAPAPMPRTSSRPADHAAQVRAAERHPATLNMEGSALPLAPDLQIQVLHIVQEALSNVRKHAGATQVWLDVQQQPSWRFEVRDNGAGFDVRVDRTKPMSACASWPNAPSASAARWRC